MSPTSSSGYSLLRVSVVSAIVSAAVTGGILFAGVSQSQALWPFTSSQSSSSSARAASPAPAISATSATTEEQAVIEAVRRSNPAVVSIVISKDVPKIEQYYEQSPIPNDPFFDQFFGPNIRIPRYRQNGTEQREVGGGTAFFVTADGLLLTNKHVADDPKAQYTAILNDGRKLQATIISSDPTNDIALLRVEGGNFPFLSISTEEPLLGQTAIAIGNSLGEFRNTVSRGVVSGLRRSITAGGARGGSVEQLSEILQTDAAINEGNSGGPLLDSRGQVIGMNTAIAGSAQNIAFAIPAADLRRALESYRKNGRIVRPYLGIRYAPITEELQERNHLTYDYGVIAVRGETPEDLAVLPGSPADKAGIRENDIILAIDGQKLTPDTSLASLIQKKLPGDVVHLKISQAGKEKEVTVTLEEWKES